MVGESTSKYVEVKLLYFIFESIFFDVPRAVSQIQPLNK